MRRRNRLPIHATLRSHRALRPLPKPPREIPSPPPPGKPAPPPSRFVAPPLPAQKSTRPWSPPANRGLPVCSALHGQHSFSGQPPAALKIFHRFPHYSNHTPPTSP